MTHTASDALHASYTPPAAAAGAQGSYRALAITGFLTAATTIVGIVAIAVIPDQMNTAALDKALAEIAAHHRAEVLAGWMFAFCLASLIPFIWLVVRSLKEATRMPATIGACIITAGATIDIVGSLLLVAVGHGISPNIADPAARTVGGALLTLGVSLDAMYNLVLGIGLVLIGRSMSASDVWPRWLTVLAMMSGVASIPVSLEWYIPATAAIQFASGTLCLVWVLGMSTVALKRSR